MRDDEGTPREAAAFAGGRTAAALSESLGDLRMRGYVRGRKPKASPPARWRRRQRQESQVDGDRREIEKILRAGGEKGVGAKHGERDADAPPITASSKLSINN